MEENRTTHLIDIPVGGKGGAVWNRLHGEREVVCEELLKEFKFVAHRRHHQQLLQSRLFMIDEALDRLMSGSYGLCSKCGRPIEEATLDVDATSSICRHCTEPDLSGKPLGMVGNLTASSPEVSFNQLNAFDTILLESQNSHYRIFLLNPYTGRALIEGGQYLHEPREGRVFGSAHSKTEFKFGSIQVGSRLEIWADGMFISTSPINSFEVKHSSREAASANMVVTHH